MRIEEKNKKTIQYIINFVVFVLLILLTFKILLKNQNMRELYYTIKTARTEFILLGFLCVSIYFILEAVNLRRTLKALGEKCSLSMLIKYVLIGFFFSSITPAATGGQPMQFLCMKRDGLSGSSVTLALLLNLFSYQCVTIAMELIGVIFLHQYMDTGIIVMFVISLIINSIGLILLIIGIFSKKLSTLLVELAVKVLKFFKYKKVEKKEISMYESLEKYNGSAKYIRENRMHIIKHFICAIVEQCVFYSVPFMVVYALRLPGINYLKMLGLQALTFGTTSGIPLPGAVGVSEGAFVTLYKHIYSEELINSAMILHRGISFYIPVCVAAIVFIIYSIKKHHKKV